MSYKTSASDFNTFKRHCRDYIDKLGLLDWEVIFCHEQDPCDMQGCRAAINASVTDRVSLIYLNRTWDIQPKDKELKKTARHEVLHLLLWSLLEYTANQDSPKEVLFGEEHAVIRRLEEIIK